jgi:hypothetical protein
MFPGHATSSPLVVHHRLLLDFTAQQVSRVCQTLDDSSNLDRLARFLWSLPDDPLSREAFDRHESVLLARAVVAYHTGQFNELYRILSSHRSVCLSTFVRHRQHCLLRRDVESTQQQNRIMLSTNYQFGIHIAKTVLIVWVENCQKRVVLYLAKSTKYI